MSTWHEAASELGRALDSVDLSLENVAVGRALRDVPESTSQKIHRLLLATQVLEPTRDPEPIDDEPEMADDELLAGEDQEAQDLLDVARGWMAARNWTEAVRHLERYARIVPTDWTAHYARGVAYANLRTGETTDLDALRAYNEAIAHSPTSLGDHWIARLLTYRGAMLKRLASVSFAKADLFAALEYVKTGDLALDAHYNLACVLALSDERELMMTHLSALKGSRWMAAVRAHVNDYFSAFETDTDFRTLIYTN